jgi:ureidoglycolate lyase
MTSVAPESSATTLLIDPLTREAFAPYGEVLGGGATPEGVLINAGTTLKINVAAPVLTTRDGQPGLFVYRTQAQALPLSLSMLECHQYGSQTFVPLADLSFVVVVACSLSAATSHATPHPDPSPDLSTLRAFWVDGHQGVTIAPGTWHHPLISLHDGELVVLERVAAQGDCVTHPLLPPVTLKARAL